MGTLKQKAARELTEGIREIVAQAIAQHEQEFHGGCNVAKRESLEANIAPSDEFAAQVASKIAQNVWHEVSMHLA